MPAKSPSIICPGDRLRYRFKGKDVRLVSRRCRLPGGKKISADLILHPGAVVIVPFLNSGTVILLKQYRPSLRKFLYEFPAGTMEKGESPLACARRELIEEAGYAGKTFIRLGAIYPVPGYSNELITIYRAGGLVPSVAPKDEDEIIRVRTMPVADIRRLFQTGGIRDGKTVAALALTRILQ